MFKLFIVIAVMCHCFDENVSSSQWLGMRKRMTLPGLLHGRRLRCTSKGWVPWFSVRHKCRICPPSVMGTYPRLGRVEAWGSILPSLGPIRPPSLMGTYPRLGRAEAWGSIQTAHNPIMGLDPNRLGRHVDRSKQAREAWGSIQTANGEL